MTESRKKVNEVHICAFCKKETSGLFSSIKLEEDKYICMDCFPKETKLMKEKGVCDHFSVHQLDYNGVKKYLLYCEKEQARREMFVPNTSWLEGNLILDTEHGYFTMKGYEEVFVIQQIEAVWVSAIYENGRFTIFSFLLMQNWIYKLRFVVNIF